MRLRNSGPSTEALIIAVQDADFGGYKNHAYCVLHFCFALRDCNEAECRKLIIAAAFHNLGIWSDGTLDYLPPSIKLAMLYLKEHGFIEWIPEIKLIIDMHHKLRTYKNSDLPLVKAFRKAELVDFF